MPTAPAASIAAKITPAPAVSATTPTDPGQNVAGPAQQVLTALQELGLESSAPPAPAPLTTSDAPPSLPTPPSGTLPAPAGAPRTLTVQLSPEHLGPVTVTLRMAAGSVDIKIAVATPEALHALEQDRHLLTAAVEAVGGSRDAVHMAATAAPAADTSSASSAPSAPFSSGTGAAASDLSAGGQARQNQRPDPTRTDPNARDDDAQHHAPTPRDRRNRRDGSLYL